MRRQFTADTPDSTQELSRAKTRVFAETARVNAKRLHATPHESDCGAADKGFQLESRVLANWISISFLTFPADLATHSARKVRTVLISISVIPYVYEEYMYIRECVLAKHSSTN